MSTRQSLERDFWPKVDRRGDDDCWPWIACLDRNGYGRMGINRKKGLATHVALLLDGRQRPGQLHALHSCHNPACVNPRHLRWGTHAENMAEKIAAGHQPRGERHGIAKLTDDKVRAIRAAQGSQAAIGRRFGISQALVSHVRRGTIWKHVA